MSLFGTHLFANDTLGQVTLPEPASDDLIRELATTGGKEPSRTVEPSSMETTAKTGGGPGMLPSSGGLPAWAPYAMVGGGLVFVGLLVWSATRRPARATPNRRGRNRRRRYSRR